MMQEQTNRALGTGKSNNEFSAMSLSELKALRKAQKATNQRIDELKLKLQRMTNEHMEQTISVIRRWMNGK